MWLRSYINKFIQKKFLISKIQSEKRRIDSILESDASLLFKYTRVISIFSNQRKTKYTLR